MTMSAPARRMPVSASSTAARSSSSPAAAAALSMAYSPLTAPAPEIPRGRARCSPPPSSRSLLGEGAQREPRQQREPCRERGQVRERRQQLTTAERRVESAESRLERKCARDDPDRVVERAVDGTRWDQRERGDG